MEDNTYGCFLLARIRTEVCHPEMALRSLLCQFWSPYAYDAQMHSLCCLRYISLAVTVHTGIIVESLPVLLAPDGLFHHTEQDWNLMICSRTHVSIITGLMRTMTLLLACIHHSLNPQPKAIIFKTMIVAIVFPLRLLWVVWPVTANQLFAHFPLQLL